MPPTDLASGVTDVLGVTVRQLELRRLEGAEKEGASQIRPDVPLAIDGDGWSAVSVSGRGQSA
jgi:hypothetical protein